MRISDWSSDVCSSDLVDFPTRVGMIKSFFDRYQIYPEIVSQLDLAVDMDTTVKAATALFETLRNIFGDSLENLALFEALDHGHLLVKFLCDQLPTFTAENEHVRSLSSTCSSLF